MTARRTVAHVWFDAVIGLAAIAFGVAPLVTLWCLS